MALSDFPRYPLLFGPSPVHRLDRLSDHLGGASIWAKREDCNSGLAFGGNKTRKLEYLVPDALAQGATHLVSIGGVQSNHTRQVAAVAAKLGLKARLDPGELGRLAGCGQRPGRQHPAVAHHGRARRTGRSRIRDRVQAELGERARTDPGRGRDTVRDSGRCLRSPPRRPGIRELGRRGRPAGAGSRNLLRHGHRLQRHWLDPRRDDRRLRRSAPPPARARHRRLGEDRRDARPGREDRAKHGCTHRAGTGTAR